MSATNRKTPAEVSQFMHKIGYNWSNEAQCFYGVSDGKLPKLTDDEARALIKAIDDGFYSKDWVAKEVHKYLGEK